MGEVARLRHGGFPDKDLREVRHVGNINGKPLSILVQGLNWFPENRRHSDTPRKRKQKRSGGRLSAQKGKESLQGLSCR